MSDNNPDNNGPDTTVREFKNIARTLLKNHYTFDGISDSSYDNYVSIHFIKPIKYTNQSGDYINDNHMKVVIEVSKQLDYKKFEINEDNEDTYKGDIFEAVENILETLSK